MSFENAILELLARTIDDYDKPDWHWHVCPEKTCGHIWYHNRQDIPKGEEEYDKAHTCPSCKKGMQFTKLFSQEAADNKSAAIRAGVNQGDFK
mgnify:CR=1 FL=1